MWGYEFQAARAVGAGEGPLARDRSRPRARRHDSHGGEELRDALAKSKRAKLDAIVQESLPRDTFKETCGAIGLDDTGKEKATFVGLGTIAKLLGHTTLAMTQRYAHLEMELLRDAVTHLRTSHAPESDFASSYLQTLGRHAFKTVIAGLKAVQPAVRRPCEIFEYGLPCSA